MQKQHTPGPWVPFPTDEGFYVQSTAPRYPDNAKGPNFGLIAECFSVLDTRDIATVKANASLIAAAPDLLAKLKEAHAELMGVACQPSDRLCHTQRARLSRLAREFGEVLRAAQPDQT